MATPGPGGLLLWASAGLLLAGPGGGSDPGLAPLRPGATGRRGPGWGAPALGPLSALLALTFALLYRWLQGQSSTEVLPEKKPKEGEASQTELQLAELEQQLVLTERLLSGLLTQLDPLSDRLDALAGAQQAEMAARLRSLRRLLDGRADSVATPPAWSGPPAEQLTVGGGTRAWSSEEEGAEMAWAPDSGGTEAGVEAGGRELASGPRPEPGDWGLRRRRRKRKREA
ncbi:coiled-coil domain-containing protein 107 isoform X2 [Tachyglossus aculeatus]|uniref:coiled-coil domain-containing protein 107 isoform X2 n=1 Tax=Tachyglossus aculeatus TaxID=9261 RepID=UPI0018F3C548|nr:coiled-coil domain-containing protein 107 isoform X2 [Tachyglossus aculeatus]